MQKLFLMLVVGVAWTLTARGAERFDNFDSQRAAGRGNTFVANPNSTESARANPAAIAGSKSSFELRWLTVDFFVGQNALDTIGDLTALDPSDGSGVSKILDTFDEKFGKRQYAGIQLLPLGIRLGHFVLEPFATTRNFIEMRVPTLPQLSLMSDSRYGAALSYASTIGKSIELGATLRPYSRIYVAGNLQATDAVRIAAGEDLETDDLIRDATGTYVGVDLGATWLVDKDFRWGFVIQDVGDTASLSDDDAPPPVACMISTGLYYRKTLGKWNLDSTLDLQDISLRAGGDPVRMLHAGWEIGRSYFTSDNDVGLQLGIRDGWFSGGAFVDLWLVRLGLANYGVEAGHSPGQRQDRRWALSAQISSAF